MNIKELHTIALNRQMELSRQLQELTVQIQKVQQETLMVAGQLDLLDKMLKDG